MRFFWINFSVIVNPRVWSCLFEDENFGIVLFMSGMILERKILLIIALFPPINHLLSYIKVDVILIPFASLLHSDDH